MATKKAKTRKASVKKAPAKKAKAPSTAKKAKASAKAKAPSASKIETRKIKAVKGQEHHFYAKFPRAKAYGILVNAPKQTLQVGTFLDKVEKIDGVKSRKQARGIVQKLVGKPGDDGTVGAVAHFVS